MEMKHLCPTYRRDVDGSKAVADELKRMVETGEFSTGEPLFPTATMARTCRSPVRMSWSRSGDQSRSDDLHRPDQPGRPGSAPTCCRIRATSTTDRYSTILPPRMR
jgi:hypothetical protein